MLLTSRKRWRILAARKSVRKRQAQGACYDCKGESERYMVHRHVWLKAFPDYRKKRQKKPIYLCFNCVEKRLSRKLNLEDFTDFPINEGLRFGFLMGCRL